MKPIIIIGAGMAAYSLAREVRKLDKAAALLIITADDGGFYSKPMLSNAFAQKKLAAQLISQSAVQMAEQIGAHIMTKTRVKHIDTNNKVVDTSSGAFDYAQLVIAVGAQAIRLGLAGDASDHVLSVNHIDDYATFRDKLLPDQKASARVTILGAGLIGCEFADDLAAHGHHVTLIDPNVLPLAALAAPALSQGLQAALSARGIDLRLGTTATSVDHADGAFKVTLANGDVLAADVVLSAVGLRPDLALAQSAQLATGRGIIVDSHGRTSAADVYALGDCAEYRIDNEGRTSPLPYIAPILTAARAIAKTLTGEDTEIDLKHSPVIVKTPSYPLALVPPPQHAIATGRWETEVDGDRTVCRFFDAQGVMVGFGVAPQEAKIRQALMAALGTTV
ncbi:rubredoxin-NAD(+) reductase [Collimonas arenae]|uniref:Rubredoxin-NAD(+) reductase n=1 Tax=Collimonas arenae TaxID=279058 RepID=A0A127PLR3_9BURK|nr:FAD-dependent oxidoreductase [Collimonas arenae]AMO98736.1 rubredoxin-NAD(+) reductase [Collimonas arenae]AMP08629.1 rubredoxin-NAD(+) reductase [Collimonas arenae]